MKASSKRREFSVRTKFIAWVRSGGRCEAVIVYRDGSSARCDAKLFPGRFRYDHIDPDWFSKDNSLDNCQVICLECDGRKTPRDQKNVAKSKRIRRKEQRHAARMFPKTTALIEAAIEEFAEPRRRKIPSRPFPKGRKFPTRRRP